MELKYLFYYGVTVLLAVLLHLLVIPRVNSKMRKYNLFNDYKAYYAKYKDNNPRGIKFYLSYIIVFGIPVVNVVFGIAEHIIFSKTFENLVGKVRRYRDGDRSKNIFKVAENKSVLDLAKGSKYSTTKEDKQREVDEFNKNAKAVSNEVSLDTECADRVRDLVKEVDEYNPSKGINVTEDKDIQSILKGV